MDKVSKKWEKKLLSMNLGPDKGQMGWKPSARPGISTRTVSIERNPEVLSQGAKGSYLECDYSEQEKRSLSFLRVIIQIAASERKVTKQQRTQLLKDVDEHRPGQALSPFPEVFGTAEQFFQRWKHGEIELRFIRSKTRTSPNLEIWEHSIPPDEPEDLDEAGEPSGHWDGLTWMPDIGGS